MVRGYDDSVQVRLAPETRPADGRPMDGPSQFLWRGRLYVVREVLGYWRERQSWWSLAPAMAAHGTGAVDERPATRPAGARMAAAGADREVWRVEAGAGRSAGSGIYDLARDAPSPVPGGPTADEAGQWLLLRVSD